VKKESIQHLLNSRVKAVCVYPNGRTLVFKGNIVSINDDSIVIFDEREQKEVILDLSIVKEVWKLD